MAEILASLGDVNGQLPANVQIDNSVDVELQVDAQRLINGQLAGIFSPAIITSWSTPTDTPELIRAIAGKLIAAKYYARVVSGEAADAIPDYAMSLYNEAINMLAAIRAGTLTVTDGDGNPIPTVGDVDSDPSADVFPNDTQGSGPQFTMDRVLTST